MNPTYAKANSFVVAMIILLSAHQMSSIATAQESPEYRENVVVVQFESNLQISGKTSQTGLSEFDRIASKFEIYTIERVYPFLDHVEPTPVTRKNLLALRRTYYVYYRTATSPLIVAKSLSKVSGVVYVDPVPVNRLFELGPGDQATPNDPRFSSQTELNLLRLPEAWDVVKSESADPRVVIAIVDGGGDWRHEDLRANVWTNEDEIPDNGLDDDSNGFVDDVHGVNFSNRNSNDPTRSPSAYGVEWHGTAAAGIAGAVSDNNIGIAGASWNALIMHINASHSSGTGIQYGFDGILYAAANGADIINASWGGEVMFDQIINYLDQTLELATDMGSLIVAAAGNLNQNNDQIRLYPAGYPRVLSVGATEKETTKLAGFSNYGKLVNVFAPGVSIEATGVNHEYLRAEGTSFATPLVAGVAALVKTRFPDLSPDALREKIRLSAESMDAPNPDRAGQLGQGFVNALVAVQESTHPGIRLKEWSWKDDDADQKINSGDIVRVKAVYVNHLEDATNLKLELVGERQYSFLDLLEAEVNVGELKSGASVEVTFQIQVTSDEPLNQRVHLFTRVQDGNFEDRVDRMTFSVNRSLNAIHQSLSAFYTSTGGDQWQSNTNWDVTNVPESEEELAQWYGITMSEGWLYALELAYNKLTQTIPSDLGGLSELQILNLFGNQLTGAIPSEINRLTNLRILYLASNSLTGFIPPEVGDLSELEYLWGDENSLSGPIPSELGNLSNLKWLDLYSNSLTGPIPASLGLLSNLTHLKLDENALSGSIPSEFENLSKLKTIRLRKNALSGLIPSSIGSLEKLELLDFGENSLTGPIPSTFSELSSLSVLKLERNVLSGTVPSELGNLSKLEWLEISENRLTGKLPRSLMQLEALKTLKFDGQALCAPKDAEFQKWLQGIADVVGPTCVSLALVDELKNQRLIYQEPITPLILPEAIGGATPITYALTPELPEGLQFEASTRTLSGTPTAVTSPPVEYTYKATDAGGETDSLQFTIEVLDGLFFPAEINDQNYLRGLPITPIIFPEGVNGTSPLSYMLTPELPEGLAYDRSSRTLSGTPADLTPNPIEYTYKVFDATGSSDSLFFTINIYVQVYLSATRIEDQTYPRAQPIPALVLPVANGGIGPIDYTLTPDLPSGLEFDASTRTLSGTPSIVTASPIEYTYKASDSATSADSLNFKISVFSPVAAETTSLPETFTVHSNYPNPFRQFTHLTFDLPWQARVRAQVMDVIGRSILTTPEMNVSPGWSRSMKVNGESLPAGLYLYRLIADSPAGRVIKNGSFVKVQ